LQNEYQLLLQKTEQNKNMDEELRSEANRLRAVMESYQVENYELRKEVHLLNEVIQEMNIQVEKAEKRLGDKRKEFSAL
jgi:predicted  nucleic acid-binding Zn-ribbon protein